MSKFVGVVKNDQWRIFKRKTVSDANVLKLPCLICKDTKDNKTGVMYYLNNAKHKVCVKCDAGLAIKKVHDATEKDQKEAEILLKLNHPGIIQVYGFQYL